MKSNITFAKTTTSFRIFCDCAFIFTFLLPERFPNIQRNGVECSFFFIIEICKICYELIIDSSIILVGLVGSRDIFRELKRKWIDVFALQQCFFIFAQHMLNCVEVLNPQLPSNHWQNQSPTSMIHIPSTRINNASYPKLSQALTQTTPSILEPELQKTFQVSMQILSLESVGSVFPISNKQIKLISGLNSDHAIHYNTSSHFLIQRVKKERNKKEEGEQLFLWREYDVVIFGINLRILSIKNINMSERLSKLVEYLNNQNYEMAITTFSDSPQKLSDHHQIQLARAFFANQNYQKSSELLKVFSKNNLPPIRYQSDLLRAKSAYMLQNKPQCIDILNKLKNQMNKNKQHYQDSHRNRVNDLLDCFKREETLNRAMTMSRYDLNKFGRKLTDLMEIHEADNLMMGMPMFLVSEKWFNSMKAYCGIGREQGQYPGIITHFQIIDDRYNMLIDPTPQKSYTNYLIFPNSSLKALPKVIWTMIREIFQGFDVRRYNISVLGKPNQIMTEIFLKKIQVQKQGSNETYLFQISKKQNWSCVFKKLSAIWKFQGVLYSGRGEEQQFVEEKAILEDVDTQGTIYIYTSMEQGSITKKTDAVQFKCNYCKKTENLKFCHCKTVKYCDMECLKQDRKNHKKKCQLQIAHIKQKAAVLQNFQLSQKSYAGKKGVVGLRNLGNTCYMNSGLQCLSNTRQLTDYFMSNKFLKDINNSNPLGTKGNLACAYAELIREMWTGKQSYVSPFKLKKIIGKFSPQFSGFGQQDSQELISYLIDGLQEDLNLVKNKETFEVKDDVLPDQEASLISELNYAKRIKSFIRDLMAGQFKSTVICSKCSRKSVCFDPYMLISLPIPSPKEKWVFYIYSDFAKPTMRISVEYDNETTVGQVKKIMAKVYRVDLKEGSWLECTIVNLDNKEIILKNIDDEDKFMEKVSLMKEDDEIFFYEFLPPKEDQKIYQIETCSSNKKINIPKFGNFSPKISDKKLSTELIPIFERFVSARNPIDFYESTPEMTQSLIKINLKKQVEMLKCKSDSQKITLSKQKKLNLEFCLKNFAMTEILEKNNEWYCNKCKKFVKATKQMEIYKTSKILVLAFKRFSRGWKVKNPIEFPVESLNMGPYIISNKSNKPVYYDLYGVVNHYGSLHGGHYTAFCKNFINNRWFQFDDSRASEIRARDAVSESAYVLFYRLRQGY